MRCPVTDTQTRNPRCACAPRFNYRQPTIVYKGGVGMSVEGHEYDYTDLQKGDVGMTVYEKGTNSYAFTETESCS